MIFETTMLDIYQEYKNSIWIIRLSEFCGNLKNEWLKKLNIVYEDLMMSNIILIGKWIVGPTKTWLIF